MKRFHVAIMKKSWGLLPKILSGEKKIESRWYKNRARPWGCITAGDVVYFKNSGEPVTVMATVERVLAFDKLTPEKIKTILEKYGQADGIKNSDLPYYFNLFKNKHYCLLIFLKNVEKVEPFEVDKTGFGAMAAWLICTRPNFLLDRQSPNIRAESGKDKKDCRSTD